MNRDDDDWSSISDHIRKEQERERLALRHAREQEFFEDEYRDGGEVAVWVILAAVVTLLFLIAFAIVAYV